MDVGARALQEQVPRKYLPVRPVHRRYICMDAVYADFAGAKIGPASCLSRHTVRPVHRRYRRPASRDIPYVLYIKKGDAEKQRLPFNIQMNAMLAIKPEPLLLEQLLQQMQLYREQPSLPEHDDPAQCWPFSDQRSSGCRTGPQREIEH